MASKKAFKSYIYIHTNVSLYVIYVYRRFQSIIYALSQEYETYLVLFKMVMQD